MQLNEIIEENTLPSISRKTRISVENLEALLARDWERLRKVQALGFISILEREYHLDLSDMRAECRAYFEAHAPVDEKGPLITATPEPEQGGFSKGLVVLVVVLAAIGGYVLFFTPSQEATESNATAVERQGGFFDSVLSKAQGWFGRGGDASMDQEGEVAEEVPAVKGAWAEGNRSDDAQNKDEAKKAEPEKGGAEAGGETGASETANESSEKKEEAKEPDEEARIIQQVKKEQAKAEEIRKQAAQEPAAPAEGEEKPLSNISKMILAATAGAASEENESGTAEGAAPETATKAESAAEAPVAQEEAPKAKAAPQQAVTDPLVVMHPRSKIWVGYTNLRTMKRSAKVTKEDITFDTAKGDYILAVGHGQIDFKTRNGEKKLNDGKRHFFMIAQGDVREISHEEFQRLNKSKVW